MLVTGGETEYTLPNDSKHHFAELDKNFIPIGWVVELSNVNCISNQLPGVFTFSNSSFQEGNCIPGVSRISGHPEILTLQNTYNHCSKENSRKYHCHRVNFWIFIRILLLEVLLQTRMPYHTLVFYGGITNNLQRRYSPILKFST